MIRAQWLPALVRRECGPEWSDSPLDLVGGEVPNSRPEDAVHNDGNEHFYFLPPVVPDPSVGGVFDAAQSPTVTICQLDGSSCDLTQPAGFPLVYTTSTGPDGETVTVSEVDEHYKVNWHTDVQPIDVDQCYRIEISVGTQVLGHADVDPVSSGSQLKNVDTNEYIALKDGRTLPIKFRIEDGAVGILISTPLRAHWKFDEAGGAVASDATGRGNDGALIGDVSLGATGVIGGAANFGTGDNHVAVPYGTDVDFGTEDFSITFWLQTTAQNEVAFYSHRSFDSCQTGGQSVTGNMEPDFVARGTVRGQDGVKHALKGTSAVNDGAWRHYALVRTDNDVTLFVDGVIEDAEAIASGLTFSTPLEFWIGRTHYCSRTPYEGLIDDFRIYDGALGASDVQALADLTALN